MLTCGMYVDADIVGGMSLDIPISESEHTGSVSLAVSLHHVQKITRPDILVTFTC